MRMLHHPPSQSVVHLALSKLRALWGATDRHDEPARFQGHGQDHGRLDDMGMDKRADQGRGGQQTIFAAGAEK